MLSAENLASIEADGAELGRIVRANPDQAVPQYPGWSLSDLAQHVAWAQGRAVTICEERATDRIKGPRLPEGMDPADWYDETLARLLEMLRSSDPETPVWGLGEMATIGFWERRMVIETAVHLWDARQAVGAAAAIGTHAALAGLDEYEERALLLGALPALAIEATDCGRSWLFGRGAATAAVSGSASDILLRIYSRPSPVVLPDVWAETLDALSAPPKP